MASQPMDYAPESLETDIQAEWASQCCFVAKENLNQEKFYGLSMLPYPSGDLHMGHVRNYTLSDVIARYEHQRGKNVLHPMGWDAFGLPAENAAIQRDLPPAQWTQKNIARMRKQLQRLGLAVDWTRELSTCEPSYYRWEQWFFIQLYKRGLVYKKTATVNWDPVDQTVLANEQVIDGKGWRSGATVEQREIPQWFFKITAYADELLDDLDTLTGWPEQVIQMQRHWIGRQAGVSITFPVGRRKADAIQVFTTRPDTLMGVTYLAIAPEHPLAKAAAAKDKAVAAFIETCSKRDVTEASHATQEKVGIATGILATHPLTREKIPVWITNYVLMNYGSGAVMAVPAHDTRDHAFALQYQLPIKTVIAPPSDWNIQESAFTAQGTLMDSGDFTGLDSNQATPAILAALQACQLGSPTTNYRLRDWGISRQRYWGTPIPMVTCPDCGDVPEPEAALPVVLPDTLIPDGKQSPLKTHPAFYRTHCPNCGGEARRETDTMDTFVESSWYFLRYCCPDQDTGMLDGRANYWGPVDHYVGGIEHAVMHLLYARFIHKALRDIGLVNTDEPFKQLLTQGMVLKDGAKMSKSKGNTVAPMPLIKQYGADTVRLFMMFAAPPEQSLEWCAQGVEGAYRFLRKVWTLASQHRDCIVALNQSDVAAIKSGFDDTVSQQHHRAIHCILEQALNDYARCQLNTVVSAGMKLLNTLTSIDATSTDGPHLLYEGFNILLRILAPITPHLCQALWRTLEYGDWVHTAGIPKVNLKATELDNIELVVQVNGKRRSVITVPNAADQDAITEIALSQDKVSQALADRELIRAIVVPGRLINLVVKG